MKHLIGTVIAVMMTGALVSAGADSKAGQAVYDKSCKSCHGADGTANPAVAKMMKVEMKALGSAEAQALSNADLKKIITEGKGKMTASKGVTGAAVDDVIAYVHTFRK
ncbi:MAG TPA: cytochrome c [Bryobacteraceae bacterium]|nr:cytochrome c [Bryobacteraceae bacterium]